MLRLPVRLVLGAYFLVDLIAAASFTNPTGTDFGITYSLGQQIDISWQGAGNFTALSLGLRQSATQNIYWIIGSPDASPSGYTASSYLWSIALGNGESISLGNEFSFWLIDGGYDVQVYSPQFYLRDPAASSTTTSSSTTSASSSTSSATTTSSQSSSKPVSATSSPTGSTTTPTPITVTAADMSSSFSASAKAGVAVGVVAAFALGLGLAYFLFRRRERSRTVGIATQPTLAYGQSNELKDYQPVSTDPYGYYGQRELPGDRPQIGERYPHQTAHEVP